MHFNATTTGQLLVLTFFNVVRKIRVEEENELFITKVPIALVRLDGMLQTRACSREEGLQVMAKEHPTHIGYLCFC